MQAGEDRWSFLCLTASMASIYDARSRLLGNAAFRMLREASLLSMMEHVGLRPPAGAKANGALPPVLRKGLPAGPGTYTLGRGWWQE